LDTSLGLDPWYRNPNSYVVHPEVGALEDRNKGKCPLNIKGPECYYEM